MSPFDKLDASWDTWYQVMRSITSLMKQGDTKTALKEVDFFLLGDIAPEVESDALGMRADLKEQLEDLEGAKNDLLTARALVGPSYKRYVHELSLGSISQRQQNFEEAVSWFRSALQTCLDGEGISGGTALKRFFAISGRRIPPNDEELCARAIRRSWLVLRLPGQPDLTDFSKDIETIKDGESKPARKDDSQSR